jgi:putative ABC transport system substrate-binding protein
MKVIGFLNSASQSAFNNFVDLFREGLKDTGYVEDQNVQIVFKWANGKYADLPKLAENLVKRNVDLIATTGGAVSARAAMRATDRIPILFVSGYNPAKIEFLEKIKGHGANSTGVNVHTTESVPWRLRELRRLVPQAKKVAVLLRPRTQVYLREKEEAKKADLAVVEASTVDELEKAFASAAKKKANALIVCADPFFTSQRKKIVALAKKYKLPAAYSFREYAEAGGLMSYGPNLPEVYRHVGQYAGKILEGTKPSEISVMMKKASDFELVINGKTAKALGLEIPEKLRSRAHVI